MENFLSAVNEPRDMFLIFKTFVLVWAVFTAMIVLSKW